MINRSTLLSLSLTVPVIVAHAQLATITDHDGNVVNSTMVEITGDAAAFSIDEGFTLTLNGEVMKVVDMVRYEMGVIPATGNYFCWGECWLPQNAGAYPTWSAMEPVNLAPGVPTNGFHAYYQPRGIEGCSDFRFVWFASSEPNDSVWVDIRFCAIEGMSVGELAKPSFSMFPNPAVGSTVQVQLDQLAGASSRMVIYDVLGGRVANHRLAKGQERMDLSTDELAPGVYFATLEENGRAVMTRRLVVQR